MKRLSLGLLIGLTILIGLVSQTIHGIWSYSALHSRITAVTPQIADDSEHEETKRLQARLKSLAETAAADLERDLQALERQMDLVASSLDSRRADDEAAQRRLDLLEATHSAWLSTAWIRLDNNRILHSDPPNEPTTPWIQLPWDTADPAAEIGPARRTGFHLEADEKSPLLTLVANVPNDEGRSVVACRFEATRLLAPHRRLPPPELEAGLYLLTRQGVRLTPFGRLPAEGRPLFSAWAPSFEAGTRSRWAYNDFGDRLYLTQTYMPARDWVLILTVSERRMAAALGRPMAPLKRELNALKQDLPRISAWMTALTVLLTLPLYLILARFIITPLKGAVRAVEELAVGRALPGSGTAGSREVERLRSAAGRLAERLDDEQGRREKAEKALVAERGAKEAELEAQSRRNQELEQELEQQRDDEKARAERIGRELEIPCATLSEVLDAPLTDSGRDRLGEALIRLRSIQDRLRDPSPDGSSGPVQTTIVDAVALCKEAVEQTAGEALDKGIKIRTLFYSRSMKIIADRETLSPILSQLLGNAVQRTGTHREVGIEAAFDWQASTVDITIWDEGSTLNEDGAQRIFDPVGSDGQGPPHAFRQKGLNLALVRHMIERLGGSIEAAPRISTRGTKFVLRFPQGGDPSATDVSVGTRLQTPGRRLLVVEDNELTRRLLIDLLTTKGYRTEQAGDGDQALSLALAEPPDLVLMDIQLPGMGGLETIRAFRKDPSLKKIPILALSAHSRASDIEECIEAGADGFVRKPVGIDSLVRAVESQFLA